MEQVGMHVVPPRHFDNSRPRRQARLNDPQLLRCRPSPPPLGTGKDRDRAHVRSLICYSVSKPRTREDSKKGGVRRTLTIMSAMNAIPAIHVAIVGAGPSGFYAAEALLRSGLPVRVDMIERLPTPFGLVRSGVAPDHPKLKEAILVYDRIAHAPGFNFLGNVSVGRDVSVAELRATHHAVVFAYG